MFLSQLRKQFFKNINDTCKITQPCEICMSCNAGLVETDTASVAAALLGAIASFRKSKPEKHFHIHLSLLKFLGQVLPQKEMYLARASVVGLPVLG